ncbi:hypothetical protein KEM52_004426, partial [Ascosphaera acerosa]
RLPARPPLRTLPQRVRHWTPEDRGDRHPGACAGAGGGGARAGPHSTCLRCEGCGDEEAEDRGPGVACLSLHLSRRAHAGARIVRRGRGALLRALPRQRARATAPLPLPRSRQCQRVRAVGVIASPAVPAVAARRGVVLPSQHPALRPSIYIWGREPRRRRQHRQWPPLLPPAVPRGETTCWRARVRVGAGGGSAERRRCRRGSRRRRRRTVWQGRSARHWCRPPRAATRPA